jgi:predicted molibdopterin-dependent oxidoreductase YjgC
LSLQNQLFINHRCEGYEDYTRLRCWPKTSDELLKQASGISEETLIRWAVDYNNEMNAVVFFSEKELSGRACQELFQPGHDHRQAEQDRQRAGGAQGKEQRPRYSMTWACIPETGPGYGSMSDENYRKVLQQVWNISISA